jgi:hypothetical protein
MASGARCRRRWWECEQTAAVGQSRLIVSDIRLMLDNGEAVAQPTRLVYNDARGAWERAMFFFCGSR